MEDCIFCKIAHKQIPSEIVYEDEKVVGFRDITPAGPVHVLVIPKEHISGVMELSEDNAAVVSHLFLAAKKVAEEQGVSENGFRLVMNSGNDAGQSVPHMHLHIIGGKAMGWPPL